MTGREGTEGGAEEHPGSCEQDTRAHGKLGKATARHAGEDFCNTRQ